MFFPNFNLPEIGVVICSGDLVMLMVVLVVTAVLVVEVLISGLDEIVIKPVSVGMIV